MIDAAGNPTTSTYSGLNELLLSLGADPYTGHLNSGASLDVLAKAGVDLEINTRNYNFNTNAYDEQSNVSLDLPVASLIEAGLHFAQEDHVTLSAATNASGTHITTSLKDLQKLGVDTVSSMPAVAMNIDLGTDGMLTAKDIPSFEKSLDLSLNLAKTQQLSEIEAMAQALAEAGIDHISLSQEQMQSDEAATQDLINAGIDFNVLVGSTPAVAATVNLTDTLDDVYSIVKDGVDVLSGMLAEGASLGDLVSTLSEAGIHRIDIDKPALVTIGDDLAAALYEAGMLNALPEAGVEIDAGFADTLQTSLAAMANLGVDHVVAKAGAQVELGADISELASLLSHFVSDTDPTSTKAIFDHGAELNMGQVSGYTAETLQSLLESGMADQLHDLGISKVVAQVDMPPVQILGGSGSSSFEFDLDILNSKPGKV